MNVTKGKKIESLCLISYIDEYKLITDIKSIKVAVLF